MAASAKSAIDMRRGRKRRIHQHHARPEFGIEAIVDLLGVVARDRNVAEQTAEKTGAGVGDLVEGKSRPGELGEDRQQARPGGGFQNDVGRCQPRPPRRQQTRARLASRIAAAVGILPTGAFVM